MPCGEIAGREVGPCGSQGSITEGTPASGFKSGSAMSWRFEQADRRLGAAFLICERRKVRIRDFLGPSEHSDVGVAKPPV